MATDGDSGTSTTQLYGAQPTFTVDGQEQPSLTDAALRVEVSDDTGGMARLHAQFENWGTPPGGGAPGFMFFDGGVLGFGKKLEVNLGPSNAARVVFSGRITAIGGEFGSASVPGVSIYAEDALAFLRMTRRTATYENISDADVAQRIASAHNLQADADAPGPTHKVLVQLGQTDLAFLRERARAIDAQLWIESDRLKFKARNDRNPGTVTLTLGETLNRFRVLADLAQQVKSAHGHGWDVTHKADPDQEAAATLLSSETKGATSGADIFERAFGARVEHVVDRATLSNEEAQALAKAELLARGRSFVRCRGETEGTADLQVGSRLSILGVGPIFEGTYFATQVTHRWERKHGYVTIFEAERPAVGKES